MQSKTEYLIDTALKTAMQEQCRFARQFYQDWKQYGDDSFLKTAQVSRQCAKDFAKVMIGRGLEPSVKTIAKRHLSYHAQATKGK